MLRKSSTSFSATERPGKSSTTRSSLNTCGASHLAPSLSGHRLCSSCSQLLCGLDKTLSRMDSDIGWPTLLLSFSQPREPLQRPIRASHFLTKFDSSYTGRRVWMAWLSNRSVLARCLVIQVCTCSYYARGGYVERLHWQDACRLVRSGHPATVVPGLGRRPCPERVSSTPNSVCRSAVHQPEAGFRKVVHENTTPRLLMHAK